MKYILLVEDDLSLISGLSFAVKKAGYGLDIAHTKSEADEIWEDGKYDLVILDVSLPDGSGFDICKRIREISKVPIMFLTARDEETDVIMGLDIGGDDYITKPFGVMELISRVKAMLRRSQKSQEKDKVLKLGNIVLDREKHSVTVGKEPVELTYKEYELLVYLAENQNRVVSRDELLDKLWDWRADVETRTLDIHIKTLRQKLGEEAGHYIKTVRSVGYRFMKPQE